LNVVLAGGGTAGHINPALAIAGYIKSQHHDAVISFAGNKNGMEYKLVTQAGYPFYNITVSGFQRKISLKNIGRNIAAAYRVLSATGASRKLLKRLKPDMVIGTGGYVSGPLLRAAAKMGIKTCIHEQNAFPGMTTKMLAPLVDRVMLTFAEAKSRINCKNPAVLTGLPVRQSIIDQKRNAARRHLGLDERPMILSTGGSLGARAINEAMIDVISAHAQDKTCYYYHAYGQYGGFVPDRLAERGVSMDDENLRITEYINDMDICLAAADIVVGRAGAGTVCEVAVAGKCAVLIPSPNVSENHQFHNALTLKKSGAAEVVEEKDLTGEKLTELLDLLIHDKIRREKMAKRALESAIFDANQRIYEVITGLL